jgi:ABC-type Fe3+-hydroxamate transport system substrate-binding protein
VEPAGEVDRVPIIGGTKNPKVERIVALAPDLVIANREENRREDVEALIASGLRVLVTDPNTVDDALGMIGELGVILECEGGAGGLVRDVRAALEGAGRREWPPRVFVAVWKAPWMGLGSESYGHDLLERCGAANVLAGSARYPQVTLEEVAALAPDIALLPDEPYPFKPSDAAAFAGIAPAQVVDGKLLWGYGPRMPGAIRRLRTLFEEARAAS